MRAFALAVTVAVAAGCTKVGSSAPGGESAGSGRVANRAGAPHELRIGDIQDISGLNPHLVIAASLGNLSQMTMAYLVRYDAQNRPAPELATVVPTQANGGVSKDGLTITWHLRHGVRWSDGAAFDGDDVVFSTKAVLNPANNEQGRDGWDRIVKIDEPDKFTVVFHLKRPYASYLPGFFTTGGANPCILPKHMLGNLPNINNAPYNSKPVGIGPFRYVSWVRGESVVLEANPYYWRGVPKLKRIVYSFIPDRNTLLTQLRTGEVDLWPYVSAAYYDRLRALEGVSVLRHPSYYFAHVDFNTSRPLVREKAVRDALRLATDRETIKQKIFHGTGTVQESMVSPASPWYQPLPLVPFDIARANKILDAAGWMRGPDGIRAKGGHVLNLDFALPIGAPDNDQLLELVRATWKQIGVSFVVHHYQPQLFFGPYASGGTLYTGKFDVTFFQWQMGPDGGSSNLYDSRQIPPNGQNIVHERNPALDRLDDRLDAAYNPDERKPLITQITRTVIGDDPTFTLRVPDDIYALNANLKNFKPNTVTPFDDVMNLDI